MSDNPEYQALLASVLAFPDDDTPRLVLADWLEEHAEGSEVCFMCHHGQIDSGGFTPWGEPIDMECPQCNGSGRVPMHGGFKDRAEFIRVQVELEKRTVTEKDHRYSDRLMGRHLNGKPLHGLQESTGWLLFRQRMLLPVAQAQCPGPFTFVRGFPQHWKGLTRDWIDDGHKIVRRYPIKPQIGMLSDKLPSPGGQFGFWSWYRWEGTLDSNVVPGLIFDLIRGFWSADDNLQRKGFSSINNAQIALATAAIEWAVNWK